MEIIKKHINNWFGNYVLITAPTGELLRVNFIYINNGKYDIHIQLAKNPQNKLFKGWEPIGWVFENEDQYSSIDQMLRVVARAYLDKYNEEQEIQNKRLKKWKDFIKNT